MRLFSISRAGCRVGRPVIAAALAMAWLICAGAPSSAAEMARPAAPGPAPRAIVPTQAPAAASTPPVEANLTRLRQKLQITPAQQPKFDAFANVMRENARMKPGSARANQNAVDDLRLAIADSELELSALKRLLPAMQGLYASLSPAQRKTADQVFRQGPAE
ncbi:MAG: Spy/CpxP family protein refolding chaperone [Stellaceae bacterium]